jgi:DMSO/TMAO reductase YedYZ molybdopterin-dependent catalytic subunit
MKRLGWRVALVGSAVATAVALILQNGARNGWQVRSLPERTMEWLLLFVPLDLFERALGQFGSHAKEIALYGTMLGMLVVLIAIGALSLRRGLHSWALLGVGVALWLFAMAVVMPLTGAGLFATRLMFSPVLTSAAYLLVFLGYASALVAVRVLATGRQTLGPIMMGERRVLLAGLAGALAAGAVARIVGRDGGLVGSSLPLASVPTRQATAEPTSTTVAQPNPTAGSAAAANTPPTAVPQPTVAPSPTTDPLLSPPPPRPVTRDSEGSLTAAGRPRGELAPTITANNDFYIVTKNAVADPVVDGATWRLIVDGEVNNPIQLDFRTLRALPAVEVTKTLECISNFTAGCNLTTFGCDLISTARWRGARLSDVLDLAGGLKPSTVALAFVSVDEFSAGLPASIADDPEALLVYEMNGQPLPREHGFPVRLLVPGRYGMKNPKWLAGIRAMTQNYQDWYEQRSWNKDGIVKTMSRIDLPVDGTTLAAGEHRVAGISYAGDRGLMGVEISTDDGDTWRAARLLEPMAGKDVMVRWEATFSIARGETITVTVRATDGTGVIQTDDFQLPQPDGASGRDAVTVSAA